nr:MULTISPECIES: class I SAM-dependent methyltransferase [Okeania]
MTAESRVLEIACGNGNAAIWLAQQTGCEVVGIDISSSYIDNARSKASKFPSLRVTFQKESATNLPFENGSFTHAWSQGALFSCEILEIFRQQLIWQQIRRKKRIHKSKITAIFYTLKEHLNSHI